MRSVIFGFVLILLASNVVVAHSFDPNQAINRALVKYPGPVENAADIVNAPIDRSLVKFPFEVDK